MLGAVCVLGAGLIFGKDRYLGASYILGDPDRNEIIDKGMYNPLTRHTTALFGIEENGSKRYLRADKMQRLCNSSTHMDYLAIQRELNR